jgi:SAM-dependent methyltransferase
MRYADRRTKAGSLELYPEMRIPFGSRMVDVDIVVDLDHSDLTELTSLDFDFFVANGVLEHLANPLLFLARLGRVMKPGARLLLSVPDRDFTFDTCRALTPVEHLVAEYEAGVTEVSDAHLVDALRHLLPSLPEDPVSRRALFDAHRERSIHVHVWDQRSMDDFLRHATKSLLIPLRLVEQASSREASGNCVYLLEKTAEAR